MRKLSGHLAASALAAIIVTIGGAGAARADVSFATGGPKDATARAAALDAVTTARVHMAPCFVRTPPAEVRVTVTVAADGKVTTAKAQTKGAAAQCAAGLLAVATFPVAPARWTAVVAITTAGATAGATAGDAELQQRLTTELGRQGAALRACQDADPAASGPASVTMRIQPDGSIGEVSVASRLGAKVDGCLARALEGMRLSPFTGNSIRYTLALVFSGGGKPGKPGKPAPVVAGAPDLAAVDGAASRGPLDPTQIRETIGRSKVAIQRCGKDTAAGRLLVRFSVRKDGTVKNLAIKESTLADKLTAACVLKVVEKLEFPLSTDETLVTFPFTFTSR